MVYALPNLHRMGGGGVVQVFWPACKVAVAYFGLDKESSQEQQGITTCTWTPYLELLLLSRLVPHTPQAPTQLLLTCPKCPVHVVYTDPASV